MISSLRRRRWAQLSVLGLVLALVVSAIGWRVWESQRSEINWLPAFVAALHPPIAGDPQHDDASLRFADVSLRQFVPLGLPGRQIRLRLSNQFGDGPLNIGGLQAAWRAAPGGSAIRSDSARTVLFSGKPAVVIAPGATLLSDPLSLPDGASADLAVSIYLPQPTPRASWHLVGSRSSYWSTPGNHVKDQEFAAAAQGRGVYFLAAVEVETEEDPVLWVAFGDSITEGYGHSVDADTSWPAQWAQRWRAAAGENAPFAVLNAGIGGNRLLSEGNGPSGMARFDRDVLDLRGVRGVILAIGINDLGGHTRGTDLSPLVQRLAAAQTELAERSRARGLKVVGATLTPVGGSFYDRPEVEAARQQFNRWVRESKVFDAVVDFDAAIRDPVDPQRIRPEWTSDRVHPDDSGYRVMGELVAQTLTRAGLRPF